MSEAEVIKRFKTGQIWFVKEGDLPTVWGVGNLVLPFQIEWEDPGVSPDV